MGRTLLPHETGQSYYPSQDLSATSSEESEEEETFENGQSFNSSSLDNKRIIRRLTICESKPFGCNAPGCVDENGQICAFETTADLSRHWTTLHQEQFITLPKKFRCALPNCARTYKNLNGLQYHAASIGPEGHDSLVASRGRPSKSSPWENEEDYRNQQNQSFDGIMCPIEGCGKTYKQLAGLRYHCVRGHHPPPTFDELYALNAELALKLQGRANALDKLREQSMNGGLKPMEEMNFSPASFNHHLPLPNPNPTAHRGPVSTNHHGQFNSVPQSYPPNPSYGQPIFHSYQPTGYINQNFHQRPQLEYIPTISETQTRVDYQPSYPVEQHAPTQFDFEDEQTDATLAFVKEPEMREALMNLLRVKTAGR